jgi:hypothetical protein
MKKSKRYKIIKKGIEKIGTRPCAVCGQKPFLVISFLPDDPAAFGMTDDQAIYTPMCAPCFNDGPDLEFLESSLLHCGVKLDVD